MSKLARGSQLEELARAAFSNYEILRLGPLPTSLATCRPGQGPRKVHPHHLEFAQWCERHRALPPEEIERLLETVRAKELERKRFIAQANELLTAADEKCARTINWNAWINLPHVELWEAVALSVGINPKSIRHLPSRDGNQPNACRNLLFPRLSKEKNAAGDFFSALAQAERAVTAEGPIVPVGARASNQTPFRASVRLLQVAQFFCACRWTGLSAEVEALADGAPGSECDADLLTPPRSGGPVPVTVAVAVPRSAHKIADRQNVLMPVIEEAARLATDPRDRMSVWNALVALAQVVRAPPPLIGFSDGEVKFMKNGAVEHLSHEAFNKRFDRRAKRIAATGR